MPSCEVVVHPESTLEVDLAGVVTAGEERLDRAGQRSRARVRARGRSEARGASGGRTLIRAGPSVRHPSGVRAASPSAVRPTSIHARGRTPPTPGDPSHSRRYRRKGAATAPIVRKNANGPGPGNSVDRSCSLVGMQTDPSRIDLLELDIDLRLTDLWREAAGIRRVVARGRRRLHARGLREGLLRRAHRGASWRALRRSRLSRPGAPLSGACRRHTLLAPSGRIRGRSRPARPPQTSRQARPGTDRFQAGAVGAGRPRGNNQTGRVARPARSPARLVVALAVAGVLAVFLLYTALWAGARTPLLQPSNLAGHTGGTVSLTGKVIGPVTGDSHASDGLRFALRNIQGESPKIPVVFRGSVPDLFKAGRDVQPDRPPRERVTSSGAQRDDDEVPEQVHRGRTTPNA